jgi:imidazolonepropionase-like amidohydrolase
MPRRVLRAAVNAWRAAGVATALALVLAGCAAREPVKTFSADLLIANANLVDVAAGRILVASDVLIRGERIVAVRASRGECSRETACVDARGRYLMPGLWDMHVHFGGGPELVDENRDLLPLYVAHGVTSVRDAAGDLSTHVLDWREQIAQGELLGPRLFTSGPKIEGKGSIWPGDLEVGTREELHAAFDFLEAQRVDFIKITDSALPVPLFVEALRESDRRGLRTSAHVPLSMDLADLVRYGLDSVEHVDYLLKPASRESAAISAEYSQGQLDYRGAMTRYAQTFDADVARVEFARLAGLGLAVVPTLNGSRTLAMLDREDHSADAFLAYLGPGLKATYGWRIERAARDDAAAISARHLRAQRSAQMMPLLQQAGVRIIAGTDAGFLNAYNYPGLGLHDELARYVEAGLSPGQALQSAILAGPQWLGLDADYGAIETGKVADLLLLTRDPLQDISATRGIEGVVLRGRWFDRSALDRLLETARHKVAAAEAALLHGKAGAGERD